MENKKTAFGRFFFSYQFKLMQDFLASRFSLLASRFSLLASRFSLLA
ncbi:hypothetical protein ACXZ7B_05800 [Vibrio owensii]